MSWGMKIMLGIGAAILLGGGLWFLYTGRSEATFRRVSPEDAKRAAAVLSKDQDGDELKDWEEELWRTDPLSSDSDGDGTLDGEEIKLGRNPLKAGSNDELDKETIESKTVPGGGDWTETDRLSRELFAKYLAIKQSGAPFTAEEEEALLADFIHRYPEPASITVYTESDIRLTEKDDVAAWHGYGNAIGSVLEKHRNTGGESELIIFERALENEDETDLASIETRVERYERLLLDFKALPAPKSMQPMAVALLNALEALKQSVGGMKHAFTDPVHTLSFATAYPSAIDTLTESFGRIALFFQDNEVVFGKDEAGYILTQ